MPQEVLSGIAICHSEREDQKIISWDPAGIVNSRPPEYYRQAFLSHWMVHGRRAEHVVDTCMPLN